MKPKNFRGRVKARQEQALKEVNDRIKRNGKAANPDEKEKKGITSDKEKQRLEQAKHEKAVLEKRV